MIPIKSWRKRDEIKDAQKNNDLHSLKVAL